MAFYHCYYYLETDIAEIFLFLNIFAIVWYVIMTDTEIYKCNSSKALSTFDKKNLLPLSPHPH